MTTVGIHQPHYLPWLRYFEKMARSDVFVVLDNVQFNKNGWQNRNKIKTAAGVTLLTVPIHDKFAQNLAEVRIDNSSSWRRKHWETLRQSYGKAPHFDRYAGFFAAVYQRDWEWLNELNRHMLEYYREALGIGAKMAYASELEVPGEATERLVNLIHAVGGDTYYSGAYALDAYLDGPLLEQAGTALRLQEWHAPTYPQLHGPFVPDLAIVDLLFNCGPDSLAYLTGEAA